MTPDRKIRPAEATDADAIVDMLSRLANETGDGERFATTPDTIREFGFGPAARFACLVAGGSQNPLGLALFFPVFSTLRGMPGVYVQDLWLAPDARGQKLGQALLAAVAAQAEREWQAGYLHLTAHHHNLGAISFYTRLGFDANAQDMPLTLSGAKFSALAGKAEVAI